jgi:hypothetical protein
LPEPQGRDAFACALAFVRARGVLRSGERVLVACGGGPASVGLLSFVRLAMEPLQLGDVHVVAVDRGTLEDGDRVADAARAARALGLSVSVVDFEGRSLEGVLRHERDARGFDVVAMGHTLEDGAARALRELLACGPIRGLAARRRDGVCRPLLRSSAAEADAITRAAGADPPTAEPSPAWGRGAALDRAVREALLPRVRTLGLDVDRRLASLARRARSR